MYLRYAARRGWKAELVDISAGNQGGIKDATITFSGDAVYSSMKYESGVHRVQRVPATEAQGRIHTSHHHRRGACPRPKTPTCSSRRPTSRCR